MFPSGIEPITNYKFLQRWFRSFKKNGRKLVVPEIYMANMTQNGKLLSEKSALK